MDPTSLEEPNITLPLSLFSSCIFTYNSDPCFPEVPKLLSKHYTDLAVVKVIRYEVGFLLKTISDPNEQFYHVELFNEEHTIDGVIKKYYHAELWLIYEWRESVAKRVKFRAAQAAINASRDSDEELAASLADALTGWKLPEDYCNKTATQIVAAYKVFDISALLKQFELVDVIAQHEKKHKL